MAGNIDNRLDITSEDMKAEQFRALNASGNRGRKHLTLDGTGTSKQNAELNGWILGVTGRDSDD